MSVNLFVCVTFVAISFSYPKSYDPNIHNKYLRLKVDFDMDVFMTVAFQDVLFMELTIVI